MYLATAMDVSWMRGHEINPVEANRVFIVTGDKTLKIGTTGSGACESGTV
jgi:hypothetical protein